MIRKEFDELKNSGRLPSPSGIGLKIMRMTQTDSWEIQDLVQLLSADPALTGRVIKQANSVQLGSVAPISTLQEAAVRIGARNVSNQALGFSLISGNRAGRCEEFDYDRFWSGSLARGVAAEYVSKRAGIAIPTQGFTCALLSAVGQLGLASVHPVAYSELISDCKADPSLVLRDLESERFAINSREVTIALMQDWGMPTYFSDAVAYQKRDLSKDETTSKQTLELVAVIRMASTLADFCMATEDEKIEMWPIMARVRDELGFDQVEFETCCGEISERWVEWGSDLKLPTSRMDGLKEIERRDESCEAESEQQLDDDNEVDQDRFRSLRILAVDDEPVSLRVLAGQLKIDGHEVLTAADGEEALALTLEFNPHIVISDWNMPIMDGLELCKALRRAKAGHSTYFLLLTGHDEEARVVEAFDGGIDDYVSKPFNPKILLARVRAALRLVNLRERVEIEQAEQVKKTAALGVLARQLRDTANTDALTSLPNRRLGMDELELAWKDWEESQENFSVIMIDIDFFKNVNDSYGHDVGDAVLQETSKVMKAVLRDGDLIARIGGEEFLVICPLTEIEGALDCAERLRVAVENQCIESGGFNGNVTISLGVSAAHGAHLDAHALLKSADEAVYLAKEQGRNCVRYFELNEKRLPKSA
ncbi:MAG: two-component system cell cycle response regulator [Planctomycetota bacterium]|jgi:two-component system cell cycle response regulator